MGDELVFDDLSRAYASGELVAFVGGAVSSAAGLPTRRGLVEHLLEVGRDYGLYPGQIEELEELVAEGELLDAISDVEVALGSKPFTKAVARALDDRGRPPPELALALAGLGQLRGVITTNLDRLVERAFESRWPTHKRPVAGLAQARGWIFKLHGTLMERDTWVLTRSEYQRAIHADPVHRALISSLFLGTPLMFVGFGFDDPDLWAVVERICTLAEGQLPSHFALVAESELDDKRRQRLAEAGIEVIPYLDPNGDHAECVRLLRRLGEQTSS